MKKNILFSLLILFSVVSKAEPSTRNYSLESNYEYTPVGMQVLHSVTAKGEISNEIFTGNVEVEALIDANLCSGEKSTLGLSKSFVAGKTHYSLVVGTPNNKVGTPCMRNGDPTLIKFRIPVRIFLEEDGIGSEEIGVLFAGSFDDFDSDEDYEIHERVLSVTVKNGIAKASVR